VAAIPARTAPESIREAERAGCVDRYVGNEDVWRGKLMGRGILLWLLGVPIPIILLLALLWH